MSLHVKYAPTSLDGVVGQPNVCRLKELVAQPYASCWLLGGEPGVGKTAAAQCVARELGCEDEWSGCFTVSCADFGVSEAKGYFQSTLRLRFGSSSGFNVLLLEELEWLSKQCQMFLKMALDPLTRLPKNVIVIATSNTTTGIQGAVLQRFAKVPFDSGMTFAAACQARLFEIWQAEGGGADFPKGWTKWGWYANEKGQREFSMREALNELGAALERVESEVACV